jgi:hypothetical protein
LPKKLKIITESAGTFSAELTGENPATADAIYAKLPIEGKASVWGEEIYFSIPVTIDLESAKPLVDVGDIAYWPPGRAICFFFGPTPASWDKEIRAASPVNVFASIENNAKLFKLISSGEKIRIEKD